MAETVGPYTPVVRAGDWLVCSGQIGVVDGSIVDGGITAELRQAIENLRVLLEGQGSSIAEVIKVTVFLTDMDDYSLVNKIYVEEFGGHRPARSAVAVVGLPMGAVVELEAWAWAPLV